MLALDENGEPIPFMEKKHPGDITAPNGRINIASLASLGEGLVGDAYIGAAVLLTLLVQAGWTAGMVALDRWSRRRQ